MGVAGKTLNVLVHCRRVDLYQCNVSVETWSVARTGWIGDVTTVLQDGLELGTEYTIEQVTSEVPRQAVEFLEPVMVWLAIVRFVEIEATMCNGCDQEAVGSCEGCCKCGVMAIMIAGHLWLVVLKASLQHSPIWLCGASNM